MPTTRTPVPLPPGVKPDQYHEGTGLSPGSRLLSRMSAHAFRAWQAAGGEVAIGNQWLEENGVDPMRLIHADGITVWLDPEAREWLQIDYFYPGVREGLKVLLNYECDRSPEDGPFAMEPAIDRLVVPVTAHPSAELLLMFESFVDGVVHLRPDLPGRYWLGAGQVRRRTTAAIPSGPRFSPQHLGDA